MIERKILIGLITSTEYIEQIRPIWNSRLLESPMAIRLAGWCIEYYDKYKQAPNKQIEDIYYAKLKKGLPKDIAEEIEEDILPELSKEYTSTSFNLRYLLDKSSRYFAERHLLLHTSKIKDLVDQGELTEAEKQAGEYKALVKETRTAINLSDTSSISHVDMAFADSMAPIFVYPKQLGQFINNQLVRGGFIAFMASEKRGKSYFLLDMALRAARQGVKVAFFQAGDMTEAQQMRRICINLAKKSDLEKYVGKMYEPVRDCVLNQLDKCQKSVRECNFGVFTESEKDIRYGITLDMLIEAYNDNPEYKPCFNCKDHLHNKIGSVWIKPIEVKGTLQRSEAKKVYKDFFVKKKRQIMLSTHANGTLSLTEMEAILDVWEKQDNFVPSLIILDYADLLVPTTKGEARHQQNDIWKGLRGLSQKKHALMVTVTQADADSYNRNRLGLKNFSEDKRKYSHVTAMYGLNQDPEGREKKIGLMRINELVIREGDFDTSNEVWILQNLKRGTPVLGSYW